MIEIGKYNTLEILRDTSVGLYLGDEEREDVLLPIKYMPDTFEIGDMIEVYVYLDYAERKVATNLTPAIKLFEFALLQVAAVSEAGAFMDMGLEKHLLVPVNQQRADMEEGRWYIIFMDLDRETDRLYGSNKINRFLSNEDLTVVEGDEVDLLICRKTELGFIVIINHLYKGLIYHNEVFRDIRIGEKTKGFIKRIRTDNKIDVSLQALDINQQLDTNSSLILNMLEEYDGFLGFNDKSPPESIKWRFGLSKKAFKKAIGGLYKARKITIDKDGIRLVESST